MKFHYKYLYTAIIFIFAFYAGCNCGGVSRKFIQVTGVVNGNTIQLHDGSTVILLGIYESTTGYQYLCDHLAGKKVAIFFDKKGRPPTSRKNKIYYAYVLDEAKHCINGEMLQSGVAQFCADYLRDSLNAYITYAGQVSSYSQYTYPKKQYSSPSNEFKGGTYIRMTKRSGVYEVPIEINDIPMNFIFDTGASSVSISLTEVEILLEQGKINREDFIRKESFVDATGRVSEGAIICLKKVKIGDKIIHNIEASVVNSTDAPLLLGQSALERFGKISVDYNKQIIYLE